MSDEQELPDWWQAVDGKWYPPERHPDYEDLPPPPTAESAARAARNWSTTPAGRDAPVSVLIPETNGTAIAALVMAILGFFLWGLGTIVGLFWASSALGQIDRSPDTQRGRGMAVAARMLCLLQLAIVLIPLAIVAALFAVGAIVAGVGNVVENISESRACDRDEALMEQAAEDYKADNGKFPTTADQVTKYLDDKSENYDFANDGSGKLTVLQGSPCD